MNLKRIFGLILTLLGIGGLIYTAFSFVQNSENAKSLLVFGILGAIFFFTGISLVKNTSDQAK